MNAEHVNKKTLSTVTQVTSGSNGNSGTSNRSGIQLGAIESKLGEQIAKGRALFFVLLDPDSESPERIIQSGLLAAKSEADAILLGGSFIGNPNFSQIAKSLKEQTQLPIILFPGGCSHVQPGPEAILFTTLISGRNPQYLIDEQVKGALFVRKLGMEALPTAYLLIESGKTTAVEYISNTRPIPADKAAIAGAHVLAAELMGQRWAYLEAGSGALNPVPVSMIQVVRAMSNIHLIVGGGLRNAEAAQERVKAGADAIVVGNLFEKEKDEGVFRSFAQAIHHP